MTVSVTGGQQEEPGEARTALRKHWSQMGSRGRLADEMWVTGMEQASQPQCM